MARGEATATEKDLNEYVRRERPEARAKKDCQRTTEAKG